MPSNNESSFNYNTSQNSMGDGGNDDENEEVQIGQNATQSSVNVRWTDKEDEALISAFMRHSTDNIIGTNQKREALWVNVKVLFDKAKASKNIRNPGMLGSRFRRISQSVMKWVGCYEEAQRRKHSGKNEENVIQEAHRLYSEAHGKFHFESCWILLKNYKKWQQVIGFYVENIGAKKKFRKTTCVDEYPDPATPIMANVW